MARVVDPAVTVSLSYCVLVPLDAVQAVLPDSKPALPRSWLEVRLQPPGYPSAAAQSAQVPKISTVCATLT